MIFEKPEDEKTAAERRKQEKVQKQRALYVKRTTSNGSVISGKVSRLSQKDANAERPNQNMSPITQVNAEIVKRQLGHHTSRNVSNSRQAQYVSLDSGKLKYASDQNLGNNESVRVTDMLKPEQDDEDGNVRIETEYGSEVSPQPLHHQESPRSPLSPGQSSPHESGERVIFGERTKRKRQRPRLGVTMYVKKDLTLAPLLESLQEDELP